MSPGKSRNATSFRELINTKDAASDVARVIGTPSALSAALAEEVAAFLDSWEYKAPVVVVPTTYPDWYTT